MNKKRVTEWWSLTVKPRPAARSALIGLFALLGSAGIWEHGDSADELLPPPAANGAGEGFEPVEPPLLTVYFPGSPPVVQVEDLPWWSELEGGLLEPPHIERVAGCDWLENWRQSFSPIRLTGNWLVVPAWDEAGSDAAGEVIRLNPGLGFGTGSHESTRLAAGLLVQELSCLSPSGRAGLRLLDIGTGSGILSILAAKMGVNEILALDIDGDALDNARENCALNGVTEKVLLEERSPDERDRGFDLVVANIIAPVLRELAPAFPRLLAPGGRLILSGLLLEQVDELAGICRRLGLETAPPQELGEWAALVAGRS